MEKMQVKGYRVAGGGGTQLYVEESGNVNGRPLLFIHGFNQSRLVWRKQISSSLLGEFRLVTMDNRGHGLSDKPRSGYGDSKLWADDIQAVIKTLQLDQPLLIGWSYGGINILDYIRHYGEGNISGVQLVGARSRIGVPEAVDETGSEYALLKPKLLSYDVGECMQAMETFIRLCAFLELSPTDLNYFLGFNAIVPLYVREGLMSRSVSNDDLLSQVEKPFFLSHGKEDAIVLPCHAQYNEEKIKNVKTSYYERAGHMPFWENEEKFNQELRDFVLSIR